MPACDHAQQGEQHHRRHLRRRQRDHHQQRMRRHQPREEQDQPLHPAAAMAHHVDGQQRERDRQPGEVVIDHVGLHQQRADHQRRGAERQPRARQPYPCAGAHGDGHADGMAGVGHSQIRARRAQHAEHRGRAAQDHGVMLGHGGTEHGHAARKRGVDLRAETQRGQGEEQGRACRGAGHHGPAPLAQQQQRQQHPELWLDA
ncbi:hypothetical protein D3C72_1649980 [compost metagenome]